MVLMDRLVSPALAAPGVASDVPATSSWQFADLFCLSDSEEVHLKRQIAQKLCIRYGDTNQDKPFAEAHGAVKPYTIDRIVDAKTTYHDLLHNGDILGDDRRQALKHGCHVSLAVSGCLVKWNHLQCVNDGYIVSWMHANIAMWDSSIERQAAWSDGVRPLVKHTVVPRPR